MNWFRNLKIAKKLNVVVAAVLAMMMGLGVFSVFQLYELDRVTNEIDHRWAPGVRNALDIKYGLTRFRTFELFHVVSTEPDILRKYEQDMESQMQQVQNSLTAYAAQPRSGAELDITAQLQASLNAYRGAVRQVVALSRHGDDVGALAVVRGESRKYDFEAMALIDKLVAINEAGSAQAAQSADQTYLHARHLIFAFMAGALVLGLLLAGRVARMISVPLGRAVDVARRVAEGDLRVDAETGGKDETAELLRAMNQMSANLQRMVTQVRGGTDTIATASAQISAGTGDLSQRTEGQAATLEETAATVEELTTTVANNADKAEQAHKLMDQTALVAREAEVAVSAVTATMERISTSSRRIGDIVGLMDGIAFQTNLLALNAAVEAARAGEHGRGFAVVAGEVRALAQRSAQSAKEIKDLIVQSLAEVNGGGQAVKDASATIDDVVRGVLRGATLMGDISNGTREQSLGLQLVNRTLASMDSVTQQNATLVEESLAAIVSLQEQAERLARSVSLFKMAGSAREELTVIDMPAPQRPRNRPAPDYSAGMASSGYMAGLV
ncbi:HAMP domain-containing protein [Pseudoduganella sp. FT25W]|uniref:HAMP domain-containing protein n=1 Tax=Duganella alba TaxID=2666081 RepID=A0A6L5QGE5_9BURK|nr:methyl-accepting chemotaxis protein [Duganella alba]MRX08735.1 HAMP domain-containing protein [Duganella alba]MRX18777.1 HAMP domain-containing protein [Duganella alba]